MKSWIILIVLAVATTAAATVAVSFMSFDLAGKGPTYPAPAKPDGPAPTLTVEGELVHQFGVMAQQLQGKHPWVFKNTGPGVLELKGMSKTCSCTTAALFGENSEKTVKIQPGESLPIEVTWLTKTWDGRFHQSVKVGTNDPHRPDVDLTVEGTVRPAITTLPADPSMSFGVVGNEEPLIRRVALYSSDRPDLKLTRVTSSNPDLLGVEARPLNEEELRKIKIEKGYAIEVTLKPTTSLGAFADEVLIETDHPQKSELRFRVAGRITGTITSTPEKVTARGTTASNGGTEVLTLWSRGGSSVKFTVDKKPQSLDVAIEPIAQAAGLKGSKYRMTVKVIPGIQPGRITDEIVLKTDDPAVTEFRVPVDVLVQGAR